MKTYTIYEAKTHFSELVRRAAAGETVRIGARGKAVVELRPAAGPALERPQSFYGVWKDRMWFAPDYDQADQEIADAIAARINR